jgi:hypothetical protein
MLPRIRAAVAAAAISHGSGRQVAALYDHGSGEHFDLKAEARGDQIACFDQEEGTRLAGQLPELLHSGDGRYLHLSPKGGGEYEGYDHGREAAFAVRVEGLVAQLYDYEAQAWFSYTAHPARF